MPSTTIVSRTSTVFLAVALAGTFATSVLAQVVVEKNSDHKNWSKEYCDGNEECKIEIKVIDGERIVIVNGDTVETGGLHNYGRMLDHHRPMFDRFLADRVLWHNPGEESFAWFGGDFDELKLLDRPHARVSRHLEFLRDDSLREIENEARTLARKARLAEGSEKAELEAELDTKLSEIFDYKNDTRRDAIEAAEKRLDKMRERQSKRESSRTEIIEQRKQELLGEESYLEW